MSGRAAFLAALLASWAASLPAQALRAPGASRGDAGTPAAAPAAPDRAVVQVEGEPRSFRIVTVAVPAALPADREVRFAIVPTGAAAVLGALSGVILPGAVAERAVVFTVRIPARMRAGVALVAHVRFQVPGVPPVELPVEIDVTRVPGASVRLGRTQLAAHLSERVAIPYVITNTGNAPDSLDVSLTVPAGWRVRDAIPRQVLQPDGTATGTLVVAIPATASTGSVRVQLQVRSPAAERAHADAVVQVVELESGAATYAPRLTAGIATVLGDTGSASSAIGLQLDGQVSERLHANGQLIEALDDRHVNTRGLGRVGYFVGSSYLTLSGHHWQATGGTTGLNFSDLTGVNLWGRGAVFSGGFARWSVATLAARPSLGGVGGDGRLLGARLGYRIGAGWLTATATDLADRQSTPRTLQAFAVGGGTALSPATTVSGELADRRSGAVGGLGWLAEVRRQVESDYLLLRYTHAPGGSGAFARVRDEFAAHGTQALRGGILVAGGYWITDDESPVFSRLHSSGLSLLPQFTVDSSTTAGVELRVSSFDARGTAGTFGNAERMIGVFANSRMGALSLSGSTMIGATTRAATTPSGLTSDIAAGRATYRGLLGWLTDRGNFQLSASVEQNGPGAGLLPRQYVLGVKAERVPVPGTGAALFTAEVQRYGWFGDRPDANLVRFGLTAPLPAGLLVTADVERNPFASGSRWVLALKVERALLVPVGRLRPAVQGAVYEDLNGNGRRDPGEPGVAGALVRRGGEAVVTDRSGRFRFHEHTDSPTRLDETTLPFGMVANSAAQPPPGAKRIDIGVLPTAPVEVELVVMPGDDGRVPSVDLRGTVVRAHDARGDVWTARVDSAGVARFYALPPSQYELEVDAGGLAEPLQPRGTLPGFTVEAGGTTPPLRIPLYPRRIRMRDGSKPGNPSGAGGEGSL